jgi:hypothetical protein
MPSEGSENENAAAVEDNPRSVFSISLDEDHSGLGLVDSRPFGMKTRLKACHEI